MTVVAPSTPSPARDPAGRVGRPGPTRSCSTSASASSASPSRAARSKPRIAELQRELDARGLDVSTALLAVGRMVLARRRARRRDPVLPRASAAREARTRADARGRRRHAGVVHARSCGTRPATRSTTPTSCGSGGGVSRSSARPTCSIPSTTRRSRTARASCCISTAGTRRAIPTRTSPRRSPSGSTRSPTGARATPTGRR